MPTDPMLTESVDRHLTPPREHLVLSPPAESIMNPDPSEPEPESEPASRWKKPKRGAALTVLLILLFFLAGSPLADAPSGPLAAQEPPTVRSILTGYGAVGYNSNVESSDTPDNFSGFVSVVPLAQINEDILVEGELEFELEENATNVVLEHIEVHYLGFESVQLKAGKFHLPIGVWSHTNWTNKMPTPPLLYQDTHGDAASGALMPIPFDLGAQATWTPSLLDGWRTSATTWVSQGPFGTFGGGHTHDGEPAPTEDGDAPLLALGANYHDNNDDKMVGLTLQAASAAGLTLRGSGFRANYDDAGQLSVLGGNLAMVWSPLSGADPMFELKGEVTAMDQEYVLDGAVETVTLEGYYLQLSRRMGAWEPVLRWSDLPRSVAGETVLIPKRNQLAVGLNYWISPSVPIKVAYNWEADRDDEFFIEWAVGF